jgi:hypothetical protein
MVASATWLSDHHVNTEIDTNHLSGDEDVLDGLLHLRR